jgi:hypothetical protein
MYFALGSDSLERGAPYLRDYYGYMGADSENVVKGILDPPEKIKSATQAFNDAGADEVMLWPCIPELDQVERLSELVGHLV